MKGGGTNERSNHVREGGDEGLAREVYHDDDDDDDEG